MNLHRIRFPEELEVKLIEECVRRGLSGVDELIPVLLEEYFQMWDDLEQGVAIIAEK